MGVHRGLGHVEAALDVSVRVFVRVRHLLGGWVTRLLGRWVCTGFRTCTSSTGLLRASVCEGKTSFGRVGYQVDWSVGVYRGWGHVQAPLDF